MAVAGQQTGSAAKDMVGRLERAGKHVSRVDLRYGNGFAATVPGFAEAGAKRVEPDRNARHR